MVIDHVWPIVSGGRFLGAAGVTGSLAELEGGLSRVRDRLGRSGWPATLSVVSPAGDVIASTGSAAGVPVDARGWTNLLEDLRRDADMVRGSLDRDSSDGLEAGADVPTPGWTVVVHLAWNAITRRVERPMFDILLAACGCSGCSWSR